MFFPRLMTGVRFRVSILSLDLRASTKAIGSPLGLALTPAARNTLA